MISTERRRRQAIQTAQHERAAELIDDARTAPTITDAIAKLLQAHATAAPMLPIGGGLAHESTSRELAVFLVEQLHQTGWTT